MRRDEDYLKSGQIKHEQAVTIRRCMNVTDKDILPAVKDGAHACKEPGTGLGTVCGECKPKAEELLHEFVHLYGQSAACLTLVKTT